MYFYKNEEDKSALRAWRGERLEGRQPNTPVGGDTPRDEGLEGWPQPRSRSVRRATVRATGWGYIPLPCRAAQASSFGRAVTTLKINFII